MPKNKNFHSLILLSFIHSYFCVCVYDTLSFGNWNNHTHNDILASCSICCSRFNVFLYHHHFLTKEENQTKCWFQQKKHFIHFLIEWCEIHKSKEKNEERKCWLSLLKTGYHLKKKILKSIEIFITWNEKQIEWWKIKLFFSYWKKNSDWRKIIDLSLSSPSPLPLSSSSNINDTQITRQQKKMSFLF